VVYRPLVQEWSPLRGYGALNLMDMPTTEAVNGAAVRRGSFARLWRALKQLFHELVGAVFAVLALAWVQSAVRAWTRDGARWLVATALLVAVVMAVFSFTSFRRARRV
jgi:uncharacterized membrane protein